MHSHITFENHIMLWDFFCIKKVGIIATLEFNKWLIAHGDIYEYYEYIFSDMVTQGDYTQIHLETLSFHLDSISLL